MREVFPSDLERLARLLGAGLESAESSRFLELLKSRDFAGILSMRVDPRNYASANSYLRDAQLAALFKKCVDLPVKVDRRSAAIEKWHDGEKRCYRSNQRLDAYLDLCDSDRFTDPAWGQANVGIWRFLRQCRKIVREWIGAVPPFGPKGLEGRFGPGATFSDRGKLATTPDKIASDPTITPGAVYCLINWVGTQWSKAVADRHGKIVNVPGNRFATVPKTALTDRSIGSEPSINIFFQLGVGKLLRQQLRRRAGWDLVTAQQVHRQVACDSSVSKQFATLDLSNASDTLCKNLVKLLLPPAWFRLLEELRSPKTLVDGKWIVLEKFSSMGNGYTFELETLVFAAICAAVLRGEGRAGKLGLDLFVFGDDIIVPDEHVKSVKAALEFCGFELNDEKSFFGDVPFRESCGGDYFAGKPVRPIYLKQYPREPLDWIVLANQLHTLDKRLKDASLSGLPRSVWFHVLDQLPSRIRALRGPAELGDLVIHEDDVQYWNMKVVDGIRYVLALKSQGKSIPWHHWTPQVVLACATYGVGDGTLGVTPRDAPRSYRLDWVPVR